MPPRPYIRYSDREILTNIIYTENLQFRSQIGPFGEIDGPIYLRLFLSYSIQESFVLVKEYILVI